MKSRIRIIVIGLCLVMVGLAAAQTVDEVLAQTSKAQGGEARAKINTVVMKAKMEFLAQDMEIPMTIYFKRPNLHRTEMEMMGKTIIQATDGKECWVSNPMMSMMGGGSGKVTVKAMDADEAEEFKHASTIDGLLSNYKQYGLTASLVGKVTRDSVEAYKVVLTDKAGKEQSFFIDTKTSLLYQVEKNMKSRNGEVKMVMTYGDYRDVAGAKFPYKIMQKAGEMDMAITYESVDVNVPVDDGMFKKGGEKKTDETKPEEKK